MIYYYKHVSKYTTIHIGYTEFNFNIFWNKNFFLISISSVLRIKVANLSTWEKYINFLTMIRNKDENHGFTYSCEAVA